MTRMCVTGFCHFSPGPFTVKHSCWNCKMPPFPPTSSWCNCTHEQLFSQSLAVYVLLQSTAVDFVLLADPTSNSTKKTKQIHTTKNTPPWFVFFCSYSFIHTICVLHNCPSWNNHGPVALPTAAPSGISDGHLHLHTWFNADGSLQQC